jgi:hypothetical protein
MVVVVDKQPARPTTHRFIILPLQFLCIIIILPLSSLNSATSSTSVIASVIPSSLVVMGGFLFPVA